METIAAPTVVEEPQVILQAPDPADDATAVERRERIARELREAILRKLRPADET